MRAMQAGIVPAIAGGVLLALAATAAPAGGPPVPAAVHDLLYARRFTLEKPYPYLYCKEKPAIREGWILVVRVDREYARPRQVDVPVLYVNGMPVERTNVGYESGRMVVFVPGKIDLRHALVYFGSMRLPEQVDAARGAEELARARAAGIRPFPKERVRRAMREGRAPLALKDSRELYHAVAALVEEYAPGEHDLAEAFRRF